MSLTIWKTKIDELIVAFQTEPYHSDRFWEFYEKFTQRTIEEIRNNPIAHNPRTIGIFKYYLLQKFSQPLIDEINAGILGSNIYLEILDYLFDFLEKDDIIFSFTKKSEKITLVQLIIKLFYSKVQRFNKEMLPDTQGEFKYDPETFKDDEFYLAFEELIQKRVIMSLDRIKVEFQEKCRNVMADDINYNYRMTYVHHLKLYVQKNLSNEITLVDYPDMKMNCEITETERQDMITYEIENIISAETIKSALNILHMYFPEKMEPLQKKWSTKEAHYYFAENYNEFFEDARKTLRGEQLISILFNGELSDRINNIAELMSNYLILVGEYESGFYHVVETILNAIPILSTVLTVDEINRLTQIKDIFETVPEEDDSIITKIGPDFIRCEVSNHTRAVELTGLLDEFRNLFDIGIYYLRIQRSNPILK